MPPEYVNVWSSGYQCKTCGALVAVVALDTHTNWHKRNVAK